ncbi:MAG: PrsW family intramembrane metalloprotease [Candidatus Kariarchaeaceae archaeon]
MEYSDPLGEFQYSWILLALVSLFFSLLVLHFYYRIDYHNSEPISEVIKAFLAGMLSPAISLPIYIFLSFIIGGYEDTTIAFINLVLVAPIVEESAKGAILFWFVRKKQLNGGLDGMIYGVAVGAGFAFIENIVYGMTTLLQGDFSGAITVVLVRGGFTFIGHPVYTGLLGWGIGMYQVGLLPSPYSRMSYSLGLHALWNFTNAIAFLVLRRQILWVILAGFVIVLLIMIMYIHFQQALRVERQLIEQGYYDNPDKFRIKTRRS